MSNSSLVNYTRISPNKTVMTNKKNTHIVIHCMAGNLTVETCGAVFAPTSRQASSNYGVGSDGRVGMYVEEKDRAWTTSSREIDSKAVTIEVANDGGAPNWHVSDTALNKTIDLCVDICKRNGIKKLNFTGDKSGNLHAHRWYASTDCPGNYLYGKFSYIASKVNEKLGGTSSSSSTTSNTTNNSSNSSVLRKGSTGSAVKTLQTNLNKTINAGLAVDGNFGSKTEKAVKDFQKKYDLAVDGIYGPKTQAKMKEVLNQKNETGLYKFNYTMNIRKGAGTDYKVVGTMSPGTYTIIRTCHDGNELWGKLKSGAGWVCISNGTKQFAKKK